MSTITKALALAAFVGVLGVSGFASAKTQATHEHPAQVGRSHAQQSNGTMQGTDIPKWMGNFEAVPTLGACLFRLGPLAAALFHAHQAAPTLWC
jgi:hypothetical protein